MTIPLKVRERDVRPAPLMLAGAVLPWVAAFDRLYALRDLEFDRRRGLHSIPVRFGESGALTTCRASTS